MNDQRTTEPGPGLPVRARLAASRGSACGQPARVRSALRQPGLRRSAGVRTAAWLAVLCLLPAAALPVRGADERPAATTAPKGSPGGGTLSGGATTHGTSGGGTSSVQGTAPAANVGTPGTGTSSATTGSGTPAGSAGTPEAPASPSEAEQIGALQRALDADRKRLEELRKQLDDPKSEYAVAEAEFNRLAAQLKQKEEAAEIAGGKGLKEEAEAIGKELEELGPGRAAALERFEIALKERKLRQGNVRSLEEKIETTQAALEKLRSVDDEPAPPAPKDRPTTGTAGAKSTTPSGTQAASGNGGGNGNGNGKTGDKTNGTASGNGNGKGKGNAAPPETDPGKELVSAATGRPAGTGQASVAGAASTATPAAPAPKRKDVLEAEEEVARKEAEAAQAEQTAKEVADRVELLRKNLELERQLKQTVEQRVRNAEEVLARLKAEQAALQLVGSVPSDLLQKIRQAEQRRTEATSEGQRLEAHIRRLEDELAEVQPQHDRSGRAAVAKRQEAETQRKRLEWLTNPLALPSVWNWVSLRLPRVLAILMMLAVVYWISRTGRMLLVSFLSSQVGRGTKEERENRAKTLTGVFHNAGNLLIVAIGAVMLLEEVGIPVAPLLGGAAVFGLAIAFGTQSLIKDYFTGFMILMEQQYLVNDIIKIGSVSGQVESITLRMTVLRDTDGSVHFIPHGQITQVTNLTHGWSRVVFEVGISYREDVDRVIGILTELAAEMRQDETFGRLILEDATMQGVDRLTESAVMIRLLIKTRPLQQWAVRREFLRRVKVRFDKEGIEMPTPQLTIFHANSNGPETPTVPLEGPPSSPSKLRPTGS